MATATLQKLIDSLREEVAGGPERANLQSLISLVDSVDETAELEVLTGAELRRFKGFRLTLHRAVPMGVEAMLRHVGAHWQAARQAVLKLSVGPEARRIVDQMIGDGWV